MDWIPESVGGEVGERSTDNNNSLEVFSMAKECSTNTGESGGVLDGVVLYCLLVSLRR